MTMNPFTEGMVRRDAQAQSSSYIFFWKLTGPMGFMSQWYPCTIVYENMNFSSAEQLMMYKKAILFKDNEMATQIVGNSDMHPSQHKQMGRRVANFNESVWSRMSSSLVVDVNFYKFVQNPMIAEMLMETDNHMLVEASPYDRVWGIGYEEGNAMMNRNRWGQNKLGKCLMAVRSMMLDMNKIVPGLLRHDRPDNPKISVNTTINVICYHCMSAIVIVPPSRPTNGICTMPMITTCHKCIDTHGLAYGSMDRHRLIEMISRHPELQDIDTGQYVPKSIFEVMHPNVVSLLDTSECRCTILPTI